MAFVGPGVVMYVVHGDLLTTLNNTPQGYIPFRWSFARLGRVAPFTHRSGVTLPVVPTH